MRADSGRAATPSKERKMSQLMRRSVMAAVLGLAGAHAARAQGLPDVPAASVLTEVMMDAQGSEAILYGNLLGVSPTSPQALSGTSSTDISSGSFTFSLNPGSTYLGQAISDSVQGQYNTATGSFDWSATGSWGSGVQWTETGNFVAAELVGGTLIWTITSKQQVKTKSGLPLYTIPDTVTILDDRQTKPALSARTSDFDFWDGTVGGTTIGTDDFDPFTGKNKFRPYKIKDLFQPKMVAPGIQELSFQQTTTGTTPFAGGSGTYTTTINSVPEPASWVMGVLGVLGLLCYTFRPRRAAVVQAPAPVVDP
jgi:hypothetical protein